MKHASLLALLIAVTACGGSGGASAGDTGSKDSSVDTPCPPRDHKACCGASVCWYDGCGVQGEKVVDCAEGCAGGICKDCTPQCAGMECGEDGCGGSCGSCDCGEACEDGNCLFTACLGRECGDDGCGGECGSCLEGQACANGTCRDAQCNVVPLAVSGTFATSQADIEFDSVTVEVVHKIDIDAYEDGCITKLRFVFRKGTGCQLAVTAGETYDLYGHLLVDSAVFSADSECPGFPDPTEGVYTGLGQEPQAWIDPGISEVPGYKVAQACFFATMTVRLEGKLASDSGKSLNVATSEIVIAGDFTSTGNYDVTCPCRPTCEGKECGDAGCGFTCGSCAPATCETLLWTPAEACISGKCMGDETLDCDDGNPCTDDSCGAEEGCDHAPRSGTCSPAKCEAGRFLAATACVGTVCPAPTESVCDDGLSCTQDNCTPATGCQSQLAANYCLIDGVCYSEGAKKQGSACRVCSTDASTGSWTNAPDSTTCAASWCDGLKWTSPTTCLSGQCIEGGSTLSCYDGLSCTVDSCVAAQGCVNALQAAYCLIDGVCYASGTHNPAAWCQVCLPSSSTTAWTSVEDGTQCAAPACSGLTFTSAKTCQAGTCSVGGTTKWCDDLKSCTKDTCSAAGGCANTLQTGYCLIDGTCYANGQINPANACQKCNSATSTTTWSNVSTGTICQESFCSGLTWTQSKTCQSGQCSGGGTSVSCDDGNFCTTDTCTAATGCRTSNNTNQCAAPRCEGNTFFQAAYCASGSCPSQKTKDCNDAYGCTSDSCSASGCSNVVNDGSCLISMQCFSEGDRNPYDGCKACSPDRTATAWTTLGDWTSCGAWDVCLTGKCSSPRPIIGIDTGRACVVAPSGKVKCWGRNDVGQLGDRTTLHRSVPTDLLWFSATVQAIGVGSDQTCVLTRTGEVYCWSKTSDGSVPQQVAGLSSGVKGIAVGSGHACAITSTNGLKCWGRNNHGQLGDGTTTERTSPVDVTGLTSGVLAVDAGLFSTCAITTGGVLKCWGYNIRGQLGDGTTEDRLSPVAVTGMSSGIKAVSTGSNTCAINASGGAMCWGYGGTGALGDGTGEDRHSPVAVLGLASGVADISVGSAHTCAVKTDGSTWCWGRNTYGAVGDGTVQDRMSPVAVTGLAGGATSVAAGDQSSCAALASGRIQCWGDNKYGQLGDGTAFLSKPVDVLGLGTGVKAVVAGSTHSCVLMDSGGIECWGANNNGQLGDGTFTPRSSPVDVSGLDADVGGLGAAGGHTCAIGAGGGLQCWGFNYWGQLGDGTFDNQPVPVSATAVVSPVQSMRGGAGHSCVLTVDGGVQCWGRNLYGELGDGSNSDSPVAVDVAGLASGIAAISAASFYSCALTSGGGLKCWGWNRDGQLGDGSSVDKPTPVDVMGLATGVKTVSTGQYHACVVTSAGGVQCWGDNSYGQLGDGTVVDKQSPVDVVGMASGIAAVSSGGYHNCAITGTGGLKCWGSNVLGQLGDGSRVDRSTPVDVLGLSGGVAAVAVGDAFTCALTVTGAIKCWGNNADGRLGDGTAWRTSPVDVVGFGP